MKAQEILEMPAGHEINELIAASVLGWECCERKTHYKRKDENGQTFFVIYGDFCPSEDIAAAWFVFEYLLDKFKQQASDPEPSIIEIWRGYERWHVCNMWLHHDGDIPLWSVEAETAPLAICRAALLAVMGGV